jgi:amino acid transporter
VEGSDRLAGCFRARHCPVIGPDPEGPQTSFRSWRCVSGRRHRYHVGIPGWRDHRVALCLGFIVLIAIGNLRGIRESGRIFAAPTYFFLVMLFSMLAVGLFKVPTGAVVPMEPAEHAAPAAALTTFLVLRAFSNGCTAITGVEAISNGVPAFQPPEEKNAAATLITMACLCVALFIGTTLLAHAYQVPPSEHETVVSQLARAVFGGCGLPYYGVQAALGWCTATSKPEPRSPG